MLLSGVSAQSWSVLYCHFLLLRLRKVLDCGSVSVYQLTSSFDFTEEVESRWGSKESFDLESRPYSVGTIVVNTLPIFDESNRRENNDAYRWANRFHIDTRPGVIRNQLLFQSRDQVTAQILAESERILRQRWNMCG